MTKTFATFAAFGVTAKAINTAMMDAIRYAQKIIDGLKMSPPCIILLSKFNRKVRISHHD